MELAIWTIIVLGIILAGYKGLLLLQATLKNNARKRTLTARYQDAEIVDAIIKRNIWQGMSLEQLIDSWGEPAEIANKVVKNKSSATYKYAQIGKNRFRNRVYVENNIVTGWDIK